MPLAHCTPSRSTGLLNNPILLSQLCNTLALIAAWDFLESKSKSKMYQVVVLSIVSPLFFANGFTLIAQIALLVVFWMLSRRKCSKETLKYCALMFFYIGLGLAAIAALYFLNRSDSVGHGVDATSMFANPKESFKYVMFGSQFGTILRGLGLYPGLEFGIANKYLAADFNPFPKLLTLANPEGCWFILGVLFTFLLLLLVPLASSKNKLYTLMPLAVWPKFYLFFLRAARAWPLGFWLYSGGQSSVSVRGSDRASNPICSLSRIFIRQ